MKVLNLYAGIGGNRKKWTDIRVTAVELNPDVAEVYKRNFPEDHVVIADAHEYLLKHFHKYDFIWSSPPCQKNSKTHRANKHTERSYPDLKLYEEVIFLKHYFKGRWIIENVLPYYKPLIKESFRIHRHLFWNNFDVYPMKRIPSYDNFILSSTVAESEKMKKWLGVHYPGNIYLEGNDPCRILRNAVHPDVGLHIFNESKRNGLFKY